MGPAIERVEHALVKAGRRVRKAGAGLTAQCPAHPDNEPSLSVNPARDFDGVVLNCHAGCDTDDILHAIGLKVTDLFDNPRQADQPTTVYTYADATGAVVGHVGRYFPKSFRPVERNGNGWKITKAMPKPRPIYRLPQVAAAGHKTAVWVVEGEKDADRGAAAGMLTCSWAGGANAIMATDWTPLRGRRVKIVADNDAPGLACADQLAAHLAGHGCEVTIHKAAQGKDLADHLAAGLGPDDLLDAHVTPEPEPQPVRLLRVRWVPDLVHAMPPEPPEIFGGWLRCGELGALAAPRAIGKTWWTYDGATLAAAGPEGFNGITHLGGHLPVMRKSSVLILQGELDEWGSAQRWQTLTMGGMAGPLPGVFESFERTRFRVVRSRVHDEDGTHDFVQGRIDGPLEETIEEYGIDLVIVDPWAVYFAGNENSNDEAEAALELLRGITLRTGVAWLIVHHITGKMERSTWTEPEDLWRGATRLADWASTRTTILPHYTKAQADEMNLDRKEARRYADVHILRRGEPTPDFHCRRGDDGWWRAWDPASNPHADLGRLVKALQSVGGSFASMEEARRVLGMARESAEVLIDHGVQAGLVERFGLSRNAKAVRLVDGGGL